MLSFIKLALVMVSLHSSKTLTKTDINIQLNTLNLIKEKERNSLEHIVRTQIPEQNTNNSGTKISN